MTDGKERAEWARTAASMLATNKSMTGAGPKFIDLIPERYRKGDEDEDEIEADGGSGFAALESGLKAMFRQNGPKIAGFTG